MKRQSKTEPPSHGSLSHTRLILSWQTLLQKTLDLPSHKAYLLCDWLTDGHWPADLESQVEAMGILRVDLEKNPLLKGLLYETWWHHAQEFSRIEEQFKVKPPLFSVNAGDLVDEDSAWMELERIFNYGQAAQTRGLTSLASDLFDQVLLQAKAFPALLPLFMDKVSIEKGAQALTLGRTLESSSCLEPVVERIQQSAEIKSGTHLGTMAASRATACMVVHYLSVGLNQKAQTALNLCRSVTLTETTSELPAGLAQLYLQLAIAQEKYAYASRIIERSVSLLSPRSKSWCLYWIQKLKIAVLRNELDLATQIFQEVSDAIRENGFKNYSLDIYEFELEIRKKNSSESLLARINQYIESEMSAQNIRNECIGKILKMACLTNMNRSSEALEIADEVFSKAREFQLRPIMLDALYHASGAAFKAENHSQLGELLRKGEVLSREMALESRKVIFSYLRSIVVRHQTKCLVLFETLSSLQLDSEVSYLIDFYGINSQSRFQCVMPGGEVIRWSDATFREFVRKNVGVYFFRKECALIVNNGETVRGIQKGTDEFFGKAIEAFLQAPGGVLSLFELHYLKSKVPFKIQYTGAVRVAVHRLKSDLKSVGIEIAADSDLQKSYKLSCSYPFYFLDIA